MQKEKSILPLLDEYSGNAAAQMAIHLLEYTKNSIFLTGKAGTGKSYLLRRIIESLDLPHILLAPTGIAALNVGGQTIHSFFQFEQRPYLPEDRDLPDLKPEKIELLKKIDLIVIDEISMVRCDLIQAIHITLSKYLKNIKPFGGKRLLIVGDLFQLPPVIDTNKPKEQEIIESNYATEYFFSAPVFDAAFDLQIVELTKVYRQSDKDFIDILNAVRMNAVNKQQIERINDQYNPQYQPSVEDFEITLTTTNAKADKLNSDRLHSLASPEYTYTATATGSFLEVQKKPVKFPAPMHLKLKLDAQVMFLKNDPNKHWVNGSLGKVSDIGNDKLKVMFNNGSQYIVEKEKWEFIEFEWNKKENRVEKVVTGTYMQFPLKPAWAITIHKKPGANVRKRYHRFGHGCLRIWPNVCRIKPVHYLGRHQIAKKRRI